MESETHSHLLIEVTLSTTKGRIKLQGLLEQELQKPNSAPTTYLRFSRGGVTHVGVSPDRKELTADARELKGELYCLPCHDKMGVPICGACRRPIEGRVVNAMGKQWHVEVST